MRPIWIETPRFEVYLYNDPGYLEWDEGNWRFPWLGVALIVSRREKPIRGRWLFEREGWPEVGDGNPEARPDGLSTRKD